MLKYALFVLFVFIFRLFKAFAGIVMLIAVIKKRNCGKNCELLEKFRFYNFRYD